MDAVDRSEDASARSVSLPDAIIPPSREIPSLCPYLATADGNWRSASPAREHRCVAVTPPVPLAIDKQRRLCLSADHATCSTYWAAVAARPLFAMDATPRGRVIARTTPVVLDQTRFDLRLPAFRSDRISGQGLLVGLLALAFVAILIARPTGNGGAVNGDGGRTPSPGSTTGAAASATPGPSAAASRAPVVTAHPVGSTPPAASSRPASPPPSTQPATSGSTYKVKSGDTLIAIAARFGTTAKVLATLNNITDPSKLHVGQVLKLP